MDDNDKNQKTEPTSRKGWWQRCRESIKETWSFTKKHAPKSAGVVGKLYYLSLISGWASLGAGMYGVPGATQVSIASFGMAKAFKLLWDQLRDIQDATEDLISNDNNPEERLDETDDKIRHLETVIAEQQETIRAQMDAGAALESTNKTMVAALTNSNEKIKELELSQSELIEAVNELLSANLERKRPTREAMRTAYEDEIAEALNNGEIERTDFDPEKNSVIRFT